MINKGYSSQSNDIAESYNRTLIDSTKAVLFNSGLPKRYWIYAITYQNFTRNGSPHRNKKNKTPYELPFNAKPDLKAIKG